MAIKKWAKDDRMSFRMKPATRKALQKAADKLKISLSDHVRQIVEATIKKKGKRNE